MRTWKTRYLCFSLIGVYLFLRSCVVDACVFLLGIPIPPEPLLPAHLPASSQPLTYALFFLLFFLLCCAGQRPYAQTPPQPHGPGFGMQIRSPGKSGPGSPHSLPDPLCFTPQFWGQAQGPACFQHGSQRASASQRWDSRLARSGAFDVCCYAFN